MGTIDEILDYEEPGVEITPQRRADGVSRWKADTENEIRATEGVDEKRKFAALARMDDDIDSAFLRLRAEATTAAIVREFPDPIERDTFLHSLALGREEQGDSFQIPYGFEDRAKRIEEAAAPFIRPRRFPVPLGGIGSAFARPLGNNEYEVIVQGNPDVGVETKFPKEFLGRAKEVQTVEDAPVQTKRIKVDRGEMAASALADLDRVKAIPVPTITDEFGNESEAPEGPEKKEKLVNEKETMFKFISDPKTDISDLAGIKLVGELKQDDKFKDSIPDNWIEQFTTRPLLKVTEGFAKTGAFALQGVLPDYAAEVTGSGEEVINAVTPGAARNRFEYTGEGAPTADLLGQGVESILTFLTPGAVSKVGGKVISMLGNTGKAAVLASRMQEVTAGANAASKAGYAAFGATSYGNSYASRMQLADATADPVKAEQIRTWAPILALADAAKEILTEQIFGVEKKLLGKVGDALPKRMLDSFIVNPAKEGLEEVGGVAIEQLYQGTPGTPESQSVGQAFRGGALGALAFAPITLTRREVTPTASGGWQFNGQDFDIEADARSAQAVAERAITEELEPAGIVSQEDAQAFLKEFEAKADHTPEEQQFAATVTAVAPLLPQRSGPIPVEDGAADTGAVATAAGGIAPAGGLLETPSPEKVVKEETLGDKVVSAEEAKLLLKPSEKEGGVDPTTKIRPNRDYILAPIRLDDIKPNQQENQYDMTTRVEQARAYADREGDFPPVILGESQQEGKWFVNDGGHRVTAARMRGDQTIMALRPVPKAISAAPALVEAAPVPVVAGAAIPAPRSAVAQAARIEEFAPGIKYFEPDTSTPRGELASMTGKLMKRRIVEFTSDKNPNSRITDGFVVTGDPNTIYIRRGTQQPLLHVLWHEWAHTIEDAPEFQSILAQLKKLEPEAWAAAEKKFDPLKRDAEFIADIAGTRGTDPAFLEKAAAQMDPTAFQAFIKSLKDLWDKIKATFRDNSRSVPLAKENIEAIDSMFLRLLKFRPAAGSLGAPVQVQQTNTLPEWRPGVYGSGWLSPDGKYQPLVSGETHEQFAQRQESTSDGLYSKGWLRVTSYGSDAFMANTTSGGSLTRQQRAAMEDASISTGKRAVFDNSKGRYETVWSPVQESSVAAEVPLRFDGTQSFGDLGSLENYTIMVPGMETTLHVEPGTTPEELQRLAREKIKLFEASGVKQSEVDEARQQLVSDFQEAKISDNRFDPDVFIYNLRDADLEAVFPVLYSDFFGNPSTFSGVVYHRTTEENIKGILEKGLLPQRKTRGIENRYTGSAIFASAEDDPMGSYGDVSISINLKKARELNPEITTDLEKPIARVERQKAVANLLEVEDRGQFDLSQSDGITPDTLVIRGHVPREAITITDSAGDIRLSDVPLSADTLAAIQNGGIGAANAITAEIRRIAGIDAAKKIKTPSDVEVWGLALQKIAKDPSYQADLIERNRQAPQALEAVDLAIVSLAGAAVRKQRAVFAEEASLAMDRGDWVANGDAMTRLGQANEKLETILNILHISGTLQSRAFSFRQSIIEDDYNITQMSYAYRTAANKGGALSEEQRKFVEGKLKELEAAQKRIEELEKRNVDAEVETLLAGLLHEMNIVETKFAGMTEKDFKTRVKVSAKAAGNRLREKHRNAVKTSTVNYAIEGIQLSSVDAMSLEDRADMMQVGVDFIENGVDTLDGFRARLIEELGDWAGSFAESTFEAAKAFHTRLRDNHKPQKGAARPSTKGAAQARKDVAAAQQVIYGPVPGEPDYKLVLATVRNNAESGITGGRNILQATLEDLKDLFPSLTLEDLSGILSRYGQATFPSKEEVEKEIVNAKRVGLILKKLSELRKKPPQLDPTGAQRSPAFQEERDLLKELNELKRTTGFTQKTEGQLKGAIDATITRLQHEIEDLEKYLAQPGGRTPEQRAGRTPVKAEGEQAAKLAKLRADRDALRKALAELEGPTVLTDEQRITAALKALERTEEALTQRLEAGPVKATPATPAITSEEIEERRSYVATLRQMLREEQDILEGRTPVTRALAAAEAALQHWLGVMDGSIVPKAPAQAKEPLSQAEEDIRLQIQAIQQVLAAEKREAARKPESQRRVEAAQKMLDRANADLDEFLKSGFPAKAPKKAALTPDEQFILDQVAAIRDTLADERRQIKLQEEIDRFDRVLQGKEAPKAKPVPKEPSSQYVEDLQLELAAMRKVLADEAREARKTPEADRRIAAAEKELARLERVMEGLEPGKAPASPVEPLTQAEEDLKLQIAAMRKVLADEARDAKRTPAAERQLKAAEKELARLEELLAGAPPKVRQPTAPLSERETEVREQILTVQRELASLRAADPDLNAERELKAVNARMEALKGKLKAGNYRKPVKTDRTKGAKAATLAAIDKAKADYLIVQKEWHTALWLESLKSRSTGRKIWEEWFMEPLKFARITMLGEDLGSVLRQAGKAFGRPVLIAESIQAGARAMTKVGSEVQWQKIASHPKFQTAMQMGLELTDPNDIVAWKREEQYQSRWLLKEFKTGSKAGDVAANAPLGSLRVLSRFQIIQINTVRFGQWLAMCDLCSRFGAPSEKEMRAFSLMANASTGRGSIDGGDFERGIGALFLAYRWTKSILEYLLLRPLWIPVGGMLIGREGARAAAIIALEYGRNLSGLGMFILAYTASHWGDDDDKWKIEWDSRSTRFAKLPFGATLVDPTAGLSGWVTMLSKFTPGLFGQQGYKKTQSGKLLKLEETDTEKPDAMTGIGGEMLSFLRYKINPILGAVISSRLGRNAIGERTTLANETVRLFKPLIIDDVRKAVKENGWGEGLALGLTAFFGMSIQTWEEKHRENISDDDRIWLYHQALSIPQLQDSVTAGDLLGHEKAVQKEKGSGTALTEDQRTELLKKTLPSVEKVIMNVRDKVKDLPADPERRDIRLREIQNELNGRVELIRKRTFQGP